MNAPHNHFHPHLDAAMEELDALCSLLGLPGDAGVAACRAAVMARLANAERATGVAADPCTDVLVRVQKLEREAVRLDQLYRARRQVLGYNHAAESIQDVILGRIDDATQAGRGWARFLVVQAGLSTKLAREPRKSCIDALAVHADGDEVVRSPALEECVSAPEAEFAA